MTSLAEARDTYFKRLCSTGLREFTIGGLKLYLKAEGFEKICLYCGGELSGRRTSYCCDLCSINFKTKFIFTHSWQIIRDEYIKKHPDCERCGKKAIEVHHKKPIRKYRSIGIQGDAFDENNLESCCSDCHLEAAKELAGEMVEIKYIKSRKETPLDTFLENPQQ